jgi:diguanylate cyclase (GGDEF)-like protein
MPSTIVLLVESDPDELNLMEKALRDEGYMLFKARTPEEAIGTLSAQEIQVVLLSAEMANGDGLDLARRIRAMRRELPVQLLVLSQIRKGEDMRRSVAAGSDDFIRKPFDAPELQARTRAAFIRWQSNASLLKEREFFRTAVAEEERLSSLVLDQNKNLKDAYDKIRRLNDELEKANRELEQIAAFDSLSGLLNRRSLFTRISIEIERSIRLDVPLTGLMVDIDRFKIINDTHGHQCGDMVIREIGGRLQAGLRKYDYAGRYGGEEFFVVLSNSTEEQAMGIGERFRKDMEESRLSCNGESFSVTVSIGVARYIAGESQESWIERTDRAMYQAKQAGRNKILAYV